MIPNLITRADFVGRVKMTPSVTTDELTVAIRDAHELRLASLDLPPALLDDLAALDHFTAPSWTATLDIEADDLVQRGGLVWRAKVTAPATVPPVPLKGYAAVETDDWAPALTETLRYLLLTPWLVYSAWSGYLLTAGLESTTAGLTQPTAPDGSFQPISSQYRTQLLADNDNKVVAYTGHVQSFLSLYRTPLGITALTCGARPAPRRGFRMRGV